MPEIADSQAASLLATLKAPLRVDAYGVLRDATGRLVATSAGQGSDVVAELVEIADLFNAHGRSSEPGPTLARLFMNELLASVPSIATLADVHGLRTLADLFNLHAAISSNGSIDFNPSESAVQQAISRLPSSERWKAYIREA